MTASVPPSTGRIPPPTATNPPTPAPTTIHPTLALAVWPLLTVSVFGALTDVGVPVEILLVVGLVVVVDGGADDFGVWMDVA